MSVKDTVFKVLQNKKDSDGWVSGQELADACGVTRTSVWKAVKALQVQGAAIEAVTNKGYRLIQSNIYNADSIRALLDDSSIRVDFFDVLDSTNTEAKRRLVSSSAKELHRSVIVASQQTEGRGRLGRRFFSPVNTGIYLSILYAPGIIAAPGMFTANAAVGVARAIKKVYGVESGIKWVNDIFINGKKVCGILTEGVTDFESGMIEAAIIGIGVNIVNNALLPQEVAGGVYAEGAVEETKRSELAAEIVNETLKILDGGEEAVKESMKEYKDRSILIGREIEVSPVIGQTEKNFICTPVDITEDAKLVVQLKDGSKKTLDCGEVSINSSKI